MQPRRQAFDGLRKEIQEFMRSSEAVLSLASMETLTDEEGEIIAITSNGSTTKPST